MFFARFFLVFALSFSVRAVQLVVPNATFPSGTTLNIQWTLDFEDPFAFGIMQSTVPDGQVKSVVAVDNLNHSLTGTVPVRFDTIGKLNVLPIAETSLESLVGEQPLPLSAEGTQVFVTLQHTIGNNSTASNNSTTTTSSTTTTPSTTTTTTSSSSTTSSVVTTTSQSPQITKSSTSHSTSTFTTTFLFTGPTATPPPDSTSQSALPESSTPAAATGATPLNTRVIVIVAAVFGSIILFLLLVCMMIRYQRSATRRRLSTFQSRFQSRLARQSSILSFYSPNNLEATSPVPVSHHTRTVSGHSTAVLANRDRFNDYTQEVPYPPMAHDPERDGPDSLAARVSPYYGVQPSSPSLSSPRSDKTGMFPLYTTLSPYSGMQPATPSPLSPQSAKTAMFPPRDYQSQQVTPLSAKERLALAQRRLPQSPQTSSPRSEKSAPMRDSWSEIMSDEPLPTYIESPVSKD